MEKTGTVDYPVSTKYREEWGEWECVREIVQNAIDSGGKVTVDSKDGILFVRDDGDGFELKHLLIGESSKDGVSTIGKFGEGMKFAFLVLLRMGCEVSVKSNGIVLRPRLVETFGAKTLSIDYSEAKKITNGTVVRVKGLENTYKDNFLSFDLTENMGDKALMEIANVGRLFVKGIFVKKIKSPVGYNLNITRENPMSGDVDMYDVRRKINSIISGTKDRKFIKLLLDVGVSSHTSEWIEKEVGSVYSMSHPKIWQNEISKHFGTSKVCYSTDYEASSLAEYKGYKTISNPAPYLRLVLKTDVEVAPPKKRKDKVRKLSDFPRDSVANVKWCRKLVETATGTEVKKLNVVDFSEREQVLDGEARHGEWIKISEQIIHDRERLLHVMMHEMVHYKYGSLDLSTDFQNQLGNVAAQVAMHLATKKGRISRDRKVIEIDREKEKADKAALLEEWVEIARKSANSTGGNIMDHLHSTMMPELFKLSGALGFNPIGNKKVDLINKIVDRLSEKI